MILLYLTLTYCPITIPRPDASCISESRYCVEADCLKHAGVRRPGYRLSGMMLAEGRK
jgi:hypothetical protein